MMMEDYHRNQRSSWVCLIHMFHCTKMCVLQCLLTIIICYFQYFDTFGLAIQEGYQAHKTSFFDNP